MCMEMKMTKTLVLDAARRIADAAITHARANSYKPLTVAVLDAGGHLLAFLREDESGILRPQIAIGKAWGALGMGCNSRALAERAQAHGAFIGAIATASDGRVVPSAGGVLIRNEAGAIIGAVGVSGDMPDNDELSAIHGIEAAGLNAESA